MPHLTTDDDVKLYYEESGSGIPIVFVHEFAGDYRSWESQVRHFVRSYRCITYNARGYPPSEVPADAEAAARKFEEGMAKAAEAYALGPTRVQFQNKDPRGWREFVDQLAEHSSEGSARTMRGVQKRRPSLFDLFEKMSTITAPTLVMTGDEDWPCLEPALLMKRTIPTPAPGPSATRGR